MHTRHAADHDTILDDCVSCKHRRVAHDNAVAEYAVVRDVCIRHQQAVVADTRLLALARRTVYRRTLADRRAVADERIALFTLKLQILRHLTNRRALEDMAVAPDLRPFLDDDVWTDLRSLADLDMIRDDRVWPDLHALCDARRRGNHRRFVDVGKYLAAACHLFQLLQPQVNAGQTHST